MATKTVKEPATIEETAEEKMIREFKESGAEEKTASGIYLPDTSKNKPQEYIVVAMDISNYMISKTVIFNRHAEVMIVDGMYLMRQDDIVAVKDEHEPIPLDEGFETNLEK